MAVNCPLLETTIEGARGVILNVVGGQDLTLDEVTDAAELVKSVVDASANIIFGARIDPNVQDEVEITVIATNFPGYENRPRDEQPRGYASRPVEQDAYPRRMTVNEPYYKSVQPLQPVQPIQPVERTPYIQPIQSVQPVQPIAPQTVAPQPQPAQEDVGIERNNEKSIPKFAQLLKNFGKKRND